MRLTQTTLALVAMTTLSLSCTFFARAEQPDMGHSAAMVVDEILPNPTAGKEIPLPVTEEDVVDAPAVESPVADPVEAWEADGAISGEEELDMDALMKQFEGMEGFEKLSSEEDAPEGQGDHADHADHVGGAGDEDFDPQQMEELLLQMFGGDRKQMELFIQVIYPYYSIHIIMIKYILFVLIPLQTLDFLIT